jgi:hypothetical protein
MYHVQCYTNSIEQLVGDMYWHKSQQANVLHSNPPSGEKKHHKINGIGSQQSQGAASGGVLPAVNRVRPAGVGIGQGVAGVGAPTFRSASLPACRVAALSGSFCADYRQISSVSAVAARAFEARGLRRRCDGSLGTTAATGCFFFFFWRFVCKTWVIIGYNRAVVELSVRHQTQISREIDWLYDSDFLDGTLCVF